MERGVKRPFRAMALIDFVVSLTFLSLLRGGESGKMIAQRELVYVTETVHWDQALTRNNSHHECFKIFWEKPNESSNLGDFSEIINSTIRIKDLTKHGILINVSLPRMADGEIVEVARPPARISPDRMKKFSIAGGAEDTFVHENLSIQEGGVRRVSAITLAEFCYSPKSAQSVGPIVSVEARVRYFVDMYNIHRSSAPSKRASFHTIVATEKRFHVGFKTTVEGIYTTQLPDEGFDEVVAKVVNTEGWKYRISLYWGSGGKATAPVTWRPYEDGNIRMVLPAFDYSQFANYYGYSGSWTGIEWGFYEKTREWVIMDPYGTPHTFTGTQNLFEPYPFAATSPVMLYSRIRPASMRSLRSQNASVLVHGDN